MRTVMLVASLIMGVLPLAGVVKILRDGEVKLAGATMDGLFLSLILLAVAGVFFLNAILEMRKAGGLKFLKREKSAPKAG